MRELLELIGAERLRGCRGLRLKILLLGIRRAGIGLRFRVRLLRVRLLRSGVLGLCVAVLWLLVLWLRILRLLVLRLAITVLRRGLSVRAAVTAIGRGRISLLRTEMSGSDGERERRGDHS